MTPRVAVVGAGIAGLATTLALRRAGVPAVAYERTEVLREVGAGIGLWPNATRALRGLGVLDALAAGSGRADRVTIRQPDGRTLASFSTARPDAPSLCALRSDVVAVLRAALPPDAVRLAAEVVAVDDGGERVRITFADGARTDADLVVGADGLRSRVRQSLVGDDPPEYRGYTAWRSVAPMPPGARPGEAFETWGPGRRFGLFDLGQGRAYWYALANRPEGETGPPWEDVARWASAWHAPIPDMLAATEPSAVVRHDVYDRPPGPVWHAGRRVLVGDAAHAMTPDVGQGGGMGLEDAVALAEALAEAGTLDAACRAYVHRRRHRAARVGRLSRWSGWLGQLDGPAATLRDVAVRAAPSSLFAAGFTSPF